MNLPREKFSITRPTDPPPMLHQRPKSKKGKSDEWGTPDELFQKWNSLYPFTLDVAASDSNAKCPLYLTKKQNGLALPWTRHWCWMNPPYSRGQLDLWTTKAKREVREGRAFGVVGPIPCSTDTQWWHRNIWAPTDCGVAMGVHYDPEHRIFWQEWVHARIGVHFVRGRVEFLWKGKVVDAARAPTAVVVWESTGR